MYMLHFSINICLLLSITCTMNGTMNVGIDSAKLIHNFAEVLVWAGICIQELCVFICIYYSR